MTAILVGILFIIGTVAGILSVVVTNPIWEAPDILTRVAASENRVALGALLVLTMGFALAVVPVLMFPIAKRHNETLALGYVVFRGGLETVTYFSWAISWLLLVPLSHEYMKGGISDASNIQALGALLLRAGETSGILTAIVFPLGALMFYSLLYQSKLIPRWISVWGVIGVALHLAGTGLAGMFGLTDLPMIVQLLAVLPILIQEMVMAVWLIAKGFSSSAIVPASAKAERHDAPMSAATLRAAR
jgi:hypothetical protein